MDENDGRQRWWHGAVLYQLYVRSWLDTNGDGYGDLPGIIQRLDYLSWLGVDGIWLSPTMPSPGQDWGYDVSDYLGVHPELGTQEDLDRLIADAGARGMRVLLDLVPNHTSTGHPWFVDAATGRDAEFRDYYVWADPASVLRFCRSLLALRRAEFRGAIVPYELLTADDGLWAYRAGPFTVAANLSDQPAELAGPAGQILLSTVGEPPAPGAPLGPWQGLIART